MSMVDAKEWTCFVHRQDQISEKVEALKAEGYLVGTWYPIEAENPDGPWMIDYVELRRR